MMPMDKIHSERTIYMPLSLFKMATQRGGIGWDGVRGRECLYAYG